MRSLQSLFNASVLWPESLPGWLLLRHWDVAQILPSRCLGLCIGRFFVLWQAPVFHRKLTVMTAPFFFGYGSLVNRRTHVYQDAHPATLKGWRRCWRHIADLDTAFLTATPSADDEIEGLIATVPGADWVALDQREMYYVRVNTGGVEHGLNFAPEVQHYHAPLDLNAPADGLRPILLSYLDVVVQGYLTEHGEAGVGRFFETTDGWDAPILNDRATPRYPRHQVLSDGERGLVDRQLSRINANLVPV